MPHTVHRVRVRVRVCVVRVPLDSFSLESWRTTAAACAIVPLNCFHFPSHFLLHFFGPFYSFSRFSRCSSGFWMPFGVYARAWVRMHHATSWQSCGAKLRKANGLTGRRLSLAAYTHNLRGANGSSGGSAACVWFQLKYYYVLHSDSF